MSELFLTLLNRGVAAGWLVLTVLILRLVLKKAPKWSHVLLWGMVGIRLISPFSLKSMLSLIPSAEVLAPEVLYDPTPTIHTGISSLNSAVNPTFSQSFAAQAPASINPLQFWTAAAGLIWAVGFAAMVLYAFISWLRLKRQIRNAVMLEQGVWGCEFVSSPFILGMIRPRIYVPLGQSLPQTVLDHEKAHIRRKDHWWKPLGFLLLAVYWFHPLLWLAYILLCRDIELACDEAVVKQLDCHGKADYSQALLACSVRRSTIAACPLAFGEVDVKNRVKSILHYKKPAFWIVVAAIAACIATAVCFLTDPKKNSEPTLLGRWYAVEEVISCGHELTDPTRDLLAHWAPSELNDLCLTEDGTLILYHMNSCEEIGNAMEEVRLTSENFDRYFVDSDLPSKLRRQAHTAYVSIRTDPDTDLSMIIYLLETTKNEKYMVYGLWDPEALQDPASDDSTIYWVVKLKEIYRSYTPTLSPPPDQRPKLTLEDVIRLSEKGDELAWSDFENYAHVDTGSGLYIWLFEIDEMFSLSIGGSIPAMDNSPMYIYLCAQDGSGECMDIRQGNVQEFIEYHKDNPIVKECSWSMFACPVGHSQAAMSTMLKLGGIPKNAIFNSIESLPVVKIENVQSLQKFTAAVDPDLSLNSTQSQMNLSFLQMSETWDEAFFRERTLFLCYTTTPTLGYDYTLEYAYVSGDTLCIGVIEYEPEVGDTALGGYLLAVAIPNEEVEGIKTVDARISSIEPMGGTEMSNVVGCYVFRDSEEMMKPTVTLYDNGCFSFTFSMISSYFGFGSYEIENDRLTLRTDDGKFIYVFDMVDHKLILDGKASSDMVWFSDIRDGSVFE